MKLLTVPALLISILMFASTAFAGPVRMVSPIAANDGAVIAVKAKTGAKKKASKKAPIKKARKKKAKKSSAKKRTAYKTCGKMMYRDKKSKKCVSAADKKS